MASTSFDRLGTGLPLLALFVAIFRPARSTENNTKNGTSAGDALGAHAVIKAVAGFES